MTTYFEHVAGAREAPVYDTVDGDPTDEHPILRIDLCEHGNVQPCPDCAFFTAFEILEDAA